MARGERQGGERHKEQERGAVTRRWRRTCWALLASFLNVILRIIMYILLENGVEFWDDLRCVPITAVHVQTQFSFKPCDYLWTGRSAHSNPRSLK